MARSAEKPAADKPGRLGALRADRGERWLGCCPRHRRAARAGLSRHPERCRRQRAGERDRRPVPPCRPERQAVHRGRICKANGIWCSLAIPIARIPVRQHSTNWRWRSTSWARKRIRSTSCSFRSTRSATRRTLKSYVASFDAPVTALTGSARRGQAGGQGLSRLLRQAPARRTATTTWTTARSSMLWTRRAALPRPSPRTARRRRIAAAPARSCCRNAGRPWPRPARPTPCGRGKRSASLNIYTASARGRIGRRPARHFRQDMATLTDEIARRRTFAIISHPDAGKTTLTEKLLLFGGAIQLAGEVKARGERRRARSDWMAIERERGISVSSAVMTFEHDGLVFNLLDTPGHQDFSEDTYRTLTAVDSAVMVHRRGARHRGADQEALRGLPTARRADHHLYQQARPRGPRPVRPDRRDRADPGARRDPGQLADRHGARFSRHLRPVRRFAAVVRARRARPGGRADPLPRPRRSAVRRASAGGARSRHCASRSRWRAASARHSISSLSRRAI